MSSTIHIDARGLPANALDAAQEFHEQILPLIREAMAGKPCVIVLFAHGDHSHETWRLAAVQELAREAAPCRVSGIAGGDQAGIEEVAQYLANAPGVTGQILQVDGNFAESD